ncbi:hypothetical protein [Streptomyces tibetensis]|uniref:hypothetical protein n=1 Tax=Streptomyces tibetensis TaxID=2382123 RepID=UPI0033E98B21
MTPPSVLDLSAYLMYATGKTARRVDVRITPQGGTARDHLNADIASADDDLLSPLSDAEREQLASLLRRVHARHEEQGPASGPG